MREVQIMIKEGLTNFIIHDMSFTSRAEDAFGVNSHVISDVVEGWNRNVFVIPDKAIKINTNKQKKYVLM